MSLVGTEPQRTARRLRAPRGRIGGRLCCERGITLIELLIYMLSSLFVFAAVITFILTTFTQENQTQSRTATNNQAEQGLEQLVADLRQAVTNVSISNPTSTTTEIQFSIPTPGAPTDSEGVAWTCPSSTADGVGSCLRVLTDGATTITRTEINNVVSMAFSATSSSGTAVTLPVQNSTSIASVGMTLSVQTSNYAYGNTGNQGSALPGASGSPIVLQATADLRNFA